VVEGVVGICDSSGGGTGGIYRGGGGSLRLEHAGVNTITMCEFLSKVAMQD